MNGVAVLNKTLLTKLGGGSNLDHGLEFADLCFKALLDSTEVHVLVTCSQWPVMT